MDQYQGNGNQGAVNDQGAEYGGTYPAPDAETPHQQQMFPQQQYQPQQQQIDPRLFNQAVERLQEWERWGNQQQQESAAQRAQQALYAEEQRLVDQYQRKRAEAERIADDDPRRALQLVDEAAELERQARRNQLGNVINAAGRSLQMAEQQARVPEIVQQYGIQDREAAEVLRTLPPEHIESVARLLGRSPQQVRQVQQQLQQQPRQQQRQQMQQSGAYRAPTAAGAPRQPEYEEGSREHLRSALSSLFPDMYQGQR